MVFHWNLSDSKSPQVSRTLLSILVDLNNAVVWMVSTCPLISKSSTPFTHPYVIVPRTPITIGIIITFMFCSFFQFPHKDEVLLLLSLSYIVNLISFIEKFQFCREIPFLCSKKFTDLNIFVFIQI